jgi:hypothetical protein
MQNEEKASAGLSCSFVFNHSVRFNRLNRKEHKSRRPDNQLIGFLLPESVVLCDNVMLSKSDCRLPFFFDGREVEPIALKIVGGGCNEN